MNYLSIPHYRGLKEKYSESLHGDGLYFTTDTHEIIANNASHGDNIASWDLHDGVLTLTMKSGAQQIVNFTEASETEKGLLSAADKKQLNNLQDNLDSKVDKVTGKSLILDSEIEKLAGLPNSTELTNSIANAKAAGDNALSDLDAHKLNVSNPHLVTKAQLGLGNVTNDAQVKRSEMGVAGGVATLDGTGKVPAAQLPAYVDDVLEGTLINATTFQLAEGQQGGVQLPNVIYVDTTTNKSYRWSGTQYVTIASDLALGETSSTAYPGDKGKAATDNINKVKSTALSHIDDITPVTYSASKVTVNYECYEGDQYGGSGTKHGADIAAASETAAGVMTAADKVQMKDLDSRATNLESRATNLESRATDLEGRATTLEGKATSLESIATTLEGKVTTLETKTSELETKESALETRVTTNEGKLTVIQGEETTDGSIKKALKDAKDYTDQKLTWIILD